MPSDLPEINKNFEPFFKEHYPKILSWFRARRLDKETSEDLAQDTLISAYKGRSTFRGESSAKTWLNEIARNIFRNYLRDQSAQKRKATGQLELDAAPVEGQRPIEIADEKSTPPDDRVIHEEKRVLLKDGILDLPSQMRQCVELRLTDMKYREIAAVMGISVETVKSHLHQARLRLREIFREGPPEPVPDRRPIRALETIQTTGRSHD